MIFDKLTPTSCEVANGDGSAQKYAVPARISTWQVIMFSEILSDFMDASSEAGAALMNAILALTQTKDVGVAAGTLRDYDAANPQAAGFGKMLSNGIRDVLKFAAKTDAIPRLMAVLFLKPGELAVENMEERVALFRNAPIALLGGAVKDFLGRKMGLLKDTPLGSQISEMMKNLLSPKKPTIISDTNTPEPNSASVGTDGSSMPLQTETSAGNTE